MEEKIEKKEQVESKPNQDTDSSNIRKTPYKKSSSKPPKPNYVKKNFFLKKKVCFFCKNKESVIDYKDVSLMKRFISESGKISPRRFTGTCAKHQRKLATEIKKARQMALIHFTDKHK